MTLGMFRKYQGIDRVAHTVGSSTQEAEAGVFLWVLGRLDLYRVSGLSEPHSETLF